MDACGGSSQDAADAIEHSLSKVNSGFNGTCLLKGSSMDSGGGGGGVTESLAKELIDCKLCHEDFLVIGCTIHCLQ